MVQALHKAGIRVILDVVYNHTFDIAGGNFDRTFPMAYYRYTADGNQVMVLAVETKQLLKSR